MNDDDAIFPLNSVFAVSRYTYGTRAKPSFNVNAIHMRSV